MATSSPKERLKVYCETSFWSWLVSSPSSNPDHAVKQAWTRKWWEQEKPKCSVYISEHVITEASRGDAMQSNLRLNVLKGAEELDGSTEDVADLAQALLAAHAVPEDEVTDAYHIATAAIHGIDVLLTWPTHGQSLCASKDRGGSNKSRISLSGYRDTRKLP